MKKIKLSTEKAKELFGKDKVMDNYYLQILQKRS